MQIETTLRPQQVRTNAPEFLEAMMAGNDMDEATAIASIIDMVMAIRMGENPETALEDFDLEPDYLMELLLLV